MFERPKPRDRRTMRWDTTLTNKCKMEEVVVVEEEGDKVHTDKAVVSKDFKVLEDLGEDLECITRVIWSDGDPFESLFGQMFGGGQGQSPFGRQSFDVQGQTTITLKEVYFGAKKTLRVPDTIVQDKDGKRKNSERQGRCG